MLEQPALALQSTTEPGQVAGRPYHAMAWHDDRNRVLAIRGPHGAAPFGVAEAARELTVGGGGAVRDRSQRTPHAMLEGRAQDFERQIERRAPAGEILSELLSGTRQHLARGPLPLRFDPLGMMGGRAAAPGGWEVDAGERRFGGGQHELADRREETGIRSHYQ